MTMHLCPNCGLSQKTEIRCIDEEFPVRGESVKVQSEVRFCTACGEQIADAVLDDRALERAYDVYRQRHGVLSVADIVETRAQYGLSQRSLAQLLGWGLVTVHRYEGGALPSEAHNQVLRSLRNPSRVQELLEQHPDRLAANIRERVLTRVRAMLEESTSQRIATEIRRVLEDRKVSEFTGFRKFDLTRVAQMVLFFSSEAADVFKTKLMKLLWYTDFSHFRRHVVSISGAAYAHLPRGPVVDHWHALLAALIEEQYINVVPDGGPGWEGDRIVPLAAPDLAVFSEDEQATMKGILRNLGHLSGKQLSDLSHDERAWKETVDGELIPYQLAMDLSLSVTDFE